MTPSVSEIGLIDNFTSGEEEFYTKKNDKRPAMWLKKVAKKSKHIIQGNIQNDVILYLNLIMMWIWILRERIMIRIQKADIILDPG